MTPSLRDRTLAVTALLWPREPSQLTFPVCCCGGQWGVFLVCRERDLTVANILSSHSVLMSPPNSYSPRNPTAPFRSLPRVLQQRESACFCLPGWLRCQLSSHWWVSHGPAISSSSLCLCAHSLFWLPYHPLSSIYQGTEKSMSAQSTFLDSLLLYP